MSSFAYIEVLFDRILNRISFILVKLLLLSLIRIALSELFVCYILNKDILMFSIKLEALYRNSWIAIKFSIKS